MVNEKFIKCKLVDYLLKTYPVDTIGVEVPFLSGKRWVDVLLITKRKELFAFEIKSDVDTLKRFSGQIKSYGTSFSKTYVVVSKKYIHDKRLKNLPRNIGSLLVSTEGTVAEVKKATPTKKLSKKNLAHFLWKSDLQKYVDSKADSVELLRSRLCKKNTVSQIYKQAVNSLIFRYKKRFSLFLSEKSVPTSYADLDYLTKTYGDIF